MDVKLWLGFFISIAILMIIARKSLWIALVISSIVLGLFSLPIKEILNVFYDTLTDSSILLLALAIGIIPIIGGVMEITGLMDDIIENLRIKKKSFLAFSSAFIGMLPMPGGALLSAPLLKRGGEGVPNDQKSAINVWYRHVLILIYPLGTLLATTKMAKINLYETMLYVLPGFILMVILGNIFLLKDIKGKSSYKSKTNPKKLAISMGIILIAPLIHFILMTSFKDIIPELFLVVGVIVSLVLAIYFGRIGFKKFKITAKKMKPIKFSLIIIGMFLFLNIFQTTDTPNEIADLDLPMSIFLVCVGFLLGFVTGRVILPVSIMLPIYLSKPENDSITSFVFTIMYFSIFLGYIISPVHPCISVSLEYFNVKYKDMFKKLMIPTIVGLVMAFIFSIVFL